MCDAQAGKARRRKRDNRNMARARHWGRRNFLPLHFHQEIASLYTSEKRKLLYKSNTGTRASLPLDLPEDAYNFIWFYKYNTHPECTERLITARWREYCRLNIALFSNAMPFSFLSRLTPSFPLLIGWRIISRITKSQIRCLYYFSSRISRINWGNRDHKNIFNHILNVPTKLHHWRKMYSDKTNANLRNRWIKF